jgi:hypothetical protein
MYCGRALPREPLGRKGAPGDERLLAEQIGILKEKRRIHLKKSLCGTLRLHCE